MLPNAEEVLNAIERKALKKAGEQTVFFFVRNYTKEGYFENGDFTPWAERKNKKNTKPILYNTGAMKKSFFVEYGKGQFTVFNTKEYSKYHQEGTSKMVARPILYDDEQVQNIIEKAVFEELDKLFTKK